MKYNVVQFVRNTAGAYTASVLATYDNLESAIVRYHQVLANLHNASDCLYAAVKIINEYGHDEINYYEFVDHQPTDESEQES